MKREEFLRYLRQHSCCRKREGRSHSVYVNPMNGERETVPRHVEIDNQLVRRICRKLGIPHPWTRKN